MKVIDTHCDALLKLQDDYRQTYRSHRRELDFLNSPALDTNLERLKQGQVKCQFFAIFIPPSLPDDEKWQHALEQVDIFYNEVLTKNDVVHIKHLCEVKDLGEHEIGAALTLEGADAFGNDLVKFRTLIRLGVLSLGLVWNNANLIADGVGENRRAGLTDLGYDVVDECNKHDVLIDVSHLNVEGFKDIIGRAERVFASHSNAREIHDHPRNLYDQQIEQIISKGGMINVVFMPGFIGEGDIIMDDLVRHIGHIISLGGRDHIGIGSDFDGIDTYVEGLNNAGDHQNLIEVLKDHFGTELAEKVTHRNFINQFCGG